MEKNQSELLAHRAMYCVMLRTKCGRYAAAQYARKHGVSGLYRLALQLKATQSI